MAKKLRPDKIATTGQNRSHPAKYARSHTEVLPCLIPGPSHLGQTRPTHQNAVDYATCNLSAPIYSSLHSVPNVSSFETTYHTAQCFFASLAARLALTSPSASHLLAFINCTTLIICLPNMTGNETAARIHGTVLSILFALHM
jgi:hypothetical protein